MALIICPDCRNRISDRAERCPHCGLPAQYFRTGEPTPSISANENIKLDYSDLGNLDAIIDYSSAKTENQGQPWSPELDRCLLDLHHKGVPVQEIAVTLKRGSGAVRSRLKKLGITEA